MLAALRRFLYPLHGTAASLAGVQPVGDEAYLSRAVDAVDLERRMREIERRPGSDAIVSIQCLGHTAI